ncbi:DUF4233 domain-containing protein [Aeromicrobium camelliae]|uniref:DUF4233 domain-containing protein n=1 Tax=Aeromicrobium camelliae TaxID=1538144 RepID=A0A3N6ZDX2_9ACTN|nr:DUF4233 domain-containing protein [Aeromicrobium camelliae]RQN08381.1 DUF4233 domain-containing protein [Aeromicrobium camelliae]
MKHMAMAVLCFEAVILGLASPVLIMVEDVPVALGLSAGLGLALLCLVACGLLRSAVGEWLGHLVQVGAIGLGFVAPIMFFVGGMFAALWAGAILLGRKIERDRARWAAAEGD